MESLPLEHNGNPVVDSGNRTSVSPHGEQTVPVMSCENLSVSRSLGSTSGEPRYERSRSHAFRVPETTSQMLSQSASGTPQPLHTSSAVPLEQGGNAPDIPIPPEAPQLQIQSPAHTRNEGINQNTCETLLEEVNPERGPMTGGIRVALLGENFPALPLWIAFGGNRVRAVSYAQYHHPFSIDPKYVTEEARCPYPAMPAPSISPSRCRERDDLSNALHART